MHGVFNRDTGLFHLFNEVCFFSWQGNQSSGGLMLKIRSQTKTLVILIIYMVIIALPVYAAAEDGAVVREIRQYVFENYVHPVDRRILEYDSVEAIFEALGDPYSRYMSPGEYEEFLEDSSGTYGGIGMEVGLDDEGVPVVITTFVGSPAEKAGLQTGDRIVKVGGAETSGKELESIVGKIKGPPGTKVNLIIIRSGSAQPFVISVTREIIQLEVIDYELLQGGVGYIRLVVFTPAAHEELEDALQRLRADGASGFILDLRGNPGGYLNSALAIADMFVPEGEPIMLVRTRDGISREVASKASEKVPLAVLVDEGSASASEIVAAAVKDNGVGKIIGTRTFGKGTVQVISELQSLPGAAVKLTIAEYLSPKGSTINNLGVRPDYTVEDPQEQLQAAERVVKELIRQQNEAVMKVIPGRHAVYLNGQLIAGEGTPYVKNGILMLPLRTVNKLLEGNVFWNADLKEARLNALGGLIVLRVGHPWLEMDGVKMQLSAAPEMVGGRVYVPVRWLGQVQGMSVFWDGKGAVITKE